MVIMLIISAINSAHAHPKHFSVNCLKNRIVWIGFNVIILEEERIYDN